MSELGVIYFIGGLIYIWKESERCSLVADEETSMAPPGIMTQPAPDSR